MKPSLALLFALTLCPAFTSAQTPPTDPVESHLLRGVELRRTGRLDDALTEFEAAYAARQDPRTAAQLGLACQAAGRWLRADALLREATRAPSNPWIARNLAALQGALDVVGRHLATVDLASDVPGVRVRVNGDDAGTLPLAAPLRVLAGSVSIDATADGHEPLALRFVAAAGESLRERLSLVPSPPAPAPPIPATAPPVQPPLPQPLPIAPPPVATPQRMPWSALAITSFAGAAALLAGGAVGAVIHLSSAGDYNSQCDAGDARGECGALRDRSVAAGAFAWTAIPVGALLAVAGGVFVTRGRATPARVAGRLTCGVGPSNVLCGMAF